MVRYALPLAGLLFLADPLALRASTDVSRRTLLIGTPTALQVQPGNIVLDGPRARQQVVVTGRYADGSLRDLTTACEITCEAADLIRVEGNGHITPRRNGKSQLVVRAGTQTARVTIEVKSFDVPQPVSFRHDVIAALNVGGCNAGACHGTPSGKNGFKLSLRGYDPDADFLQLTRDVLGRRTTRHTSESSLILLKALGLVPHEGGLRFSRNSVAAQTIRGWLAEGLRDDRPKLPGVASLEVLPGSRVLKAPARQQQLAVMAKFEDGTVRDVTRLTVFSSSDPSVADVDVNGLITFAQTGEVAILVRYLMELQTVRITYLEPRPGFVWRNPTEVNYVDRHVFSKLKLLNIPPSDLCDDSEYIRRAFLDLIGVLPTADEVRAFLADKRPDKRARLVDALLERPEYADYWTLKWSDVLRSNRKTIQVRGIHVFQRWLKGHLGRDTGFDRVTQELITAKGNTFANPAANYYRIARTPTDLAETTAQLFLGVRMQCAKCHNHPFERWTQDDYYNLAAFFARVKQKRDPNDPGPAPNQPGAEVIFSARAGEVNQARTGKVAPPRFPGASSVEVPIVGDRREVLAKWLTGKDNPFFARNVVNRVWYHLMGRGIVDPVDDFRDSNPSANDDLLDALAKDFADRGFRFKPLIKTIMTSRTYQLSAQPNADNKDDNRYFSHAVTRRLPAEVLLDALSSSLEVGERFAGLPAGTRAVQLPDGEYNHPFLKAFGQPARELACECEREGDSNLAQALQLINGPTLNDKLRNPQNRIGRLLGRKASEREMIEELYLATLSRLPSEEDMKVCVEFLGKAADKRKGWEDLHWALINTREFLFRH